MSDFAARLAAWGAQLDEVARGITDLQRDFDRREGVVDWRDMAGVQKRVEAVFASPEGVALVRRCRALVREMEPLYFDPSRAPEERAAVGALFRARRQATWVALCVSGEDLRAFSEAKSEETLRASLRGLAVIDFGSDPRDRELYVGRARAAVLAAWGSGGMERARPIVEEVTAACSPGMGGALSRAFGKAKRKRR